MIAVCSDKQKTHKCTMWAEQGRAQHSTTQYIWTETCSQVQYIPWRLGFKKV